MQLLLLATSVLTIVVGTFVGLRLLGVARRTRELPELMIAVSLLSFAAVAYPTLLASMGAFKQLGPTLTHALLTVSATAYVVTLVCSTIFTRRIFRPQASWAQAMVLAVAAIEMTGAVLVTASFDYSLLGRSAVAAREGVSGAVLGSQLMAAGFVVAFAWTGVESLLYWVRVRRQWRLGLADPVLVNRFWVWGLGSTISATIALMLIGLTLLGMNASNHPAPSALQSVSGLASSICWYLTFTAPARYREWIERRYAAAPGT